MVTTPNKYKISRELYKIIRKDYIIKSKSYYSQRMSEDDFIDYTLRNLNETEFFIECFNFLKLKCSFTINKESIIINNTVTINNIDSKGLIFDACEYIIKDNNENIF